MKCVRISDSPVDLMIYISFMNMKMEHEAISFHHRFWLPDCNAQNDRSVKRSSWNSIHSSARPEMRGSFTVLVTSGLLFQLKNWIEHTKTRLECDEKRSGKHQKGWIIDIVVCECSLLLLLPLVTHSIRIEKIFFIGISVVTYRF